MKHSFGSKEWAAESWRVSATSSCRFHRGSAGLNERAIRHDVRRNIELAWGAGGRRMRHDPEEYTRLLRSASTRPRASHFLVHGSFDTRDQLVEIARRGAAIGAAGLLLGQPNSFYPRDENELYDYLAGVANDVDIAVCLFATVQMNLSRFHTSGYPQSVLVRAADLPNVVAIKYEVGRPGMAGDLEMWKQLRGKRVLFSDPLEAHSPLTVEMFGMQWMGRAIRVPGGAVPEYFALLQRGESDRAMEITGASIRPPGTRRNPGDVRRRELHPSLSVEVPGVAAGLQRRPDASAGHEAQRFADAHGA
jgi:4-hydroxy-tetrahydrodipicolinate synthase